MIFRNLKTGGILAFMAACHSSSSVITAKKTPTVSRMLKAKTKRAKHTRLWGHVPPRKSLEIRCCMLLVASETRSVRVAT